MYFAADIVKWTLGGRQDIVDCIANAGSSNAVIPKDEYITTLPDLAYLKGGTDHIGRTYHSFEIRGTGATKDSRVSTFGEETLEGISPRDIGIIVHEFAHAIDGLCFTEDDHNSWEDFYNEAVQADRFPGEYLMTTRYEFFAVYSASYFGVTDEVGDRHTSRQRFSVDSPAIFKSLQEIYGTPASYLDLPSLQTKIPVSPVDREALVALYNATDGDNWINSTNWLSDAPAGKWYGVTINRSGRVTSLDLSSNRLNGEIPAELGNLSKLRHLLFWSNLLTGELPSELANLTDLESFAVGGNRLSGEIPAWLGSLTNLRELHLLTNRFTGLVPSWLGSLPLRRLLLGNNQLTGEVPAELGHLTDLRSFWIGGNNLTGCIPDGLRNVPENDLSWLRLPDCDGQ